MTDRPHVLILHGALGSASQMQSLFSSAVDFTPLFFEFPGHGKNQDIDQPWTVQLFQDSLEDFCRMQTIPLYVFGYSMGGYIALSLALSRPELFQGILTLGTKLAWDKSTAEKESSRLNPEIIQVKVPSIADTLKARHGENHWIDVLRKTSELMHSIGINPTLSISRMKNIKVPVHYCLADQDSLVSREETIAFQNATSGSVFTLLENSFHPIEQVHIQLIFSEIRKLIQL